MTWGVLVLAALATYRLTRLVTTDDLTEPMRHRVLVRFPPRRGALEDDLGRPIPGSSRLVPSLPVTFVNCSWCVSVWIAGIVLVAVHFAGLLPSWQLAAVAWLAVATSAGLLSEIGG